MKGVEIMMETRNSRGLTNGRKDRQTDGQTHGQCENNMPPVLVIKNVCIPVFGLVKFHCTDNLADDTLRRRLFAEPMDLSILILCLLKFEQSHHYVR